MTDTRELTMDDYLAMARRRLKVVLIPLLIAPVAGFLVSYAPFFPPKYTSVSQVLVLGQKVPANYVQPVITADFTQRVSTLQQQVLGASRLRAMIDNLGLAKPGEEGKLIEEIRGNLQVMPVITSMAAVPTPGAKKKASVTDEPAPGFNVSYSDSDPERAQRICNEMTAQILNENLKNRAEIAGNTTAFLDRQVEDAKRAIDQQDSKLAEFKKKYFGQLPGDAENNMRMLMSLNTQLDATTQNLNRAQQDKSYTESMLAQQVAAWKSSQSSSTSPQTLEQQLTTLQAQLMQLQARYTDDYPDVIKTKADIAKVQSRLDEINKQAANATTPSDKANANEPAEIRQLRLQIHQYQGIIDQSTSDQKKLQASINHYQSLTAMSPNVEEQYKQLTRDYDNAQTFYKELLAKQSAANLGKDMESQAQGEQMMILQYAGKSESPSFPNRPLFAAAGMGAGLGLGFLIAIWLEFSDKAIRTEKDAAAVMDLPLLISVPWLGEEEEEASDGYGRRSFWRRGSTNGKDREKVEV